MSRVDPKVLEMMLQEIRDVRHAQNRLEEKSETESRYTREQLGLIRVDIASLKVKAGIMGSLAGMAASGLFKFLMKGN